MDHQKIFLLTENEYLNKNFQSRNQIVLCSILYKYSITYVYVS